MQPSTMVADKAILLPARMAARRKYDAIRDEGRTPVHTFYFAVSIFCAMKLWKTIYVIRKRDPAKIKGYFVFIAF